MSPDTVRSLIDGAVVVGFAIVGALLLLGVGALIGVFTNRDDDWMWHGEAEPPPEVPDRHDGRRLR